MSWNAKSLFARVARTAAVLMACLLALAIAAPSRAFAADGLAVSQEVTKHGIRPDGMDWTFNYELRGVSDEAPLPASAQDGVFSFTLTDDGDSINLPVVFDGTSGTVLSYTHAGVYEYELTCTSEGTDRLTVDNSTYSIFVNVINGDDGALILKEIVVRDVKSGDKPIDLTYHHEYRGSAATLTVVDPPVSKKIEGGVPAEKSTFHFTMIADDSSAPMPSGSAEGTKTLQIVGEGQEEFGEVTFTEPGTYAYDVHEVNDGVEGYTYDTTTWRVVYEVTGDDSHLEAVCHVYKDGVEVDETVCSFVNKYEGKQAPLPERIIRRLMPSTGDPTWGMLQLSGALLVAGIVALGAGVYNKRKARREQSRR